MSATRTWLRPPCLAAYRAWSARSIRVVNSAGFVGGGDADADGQLQPAGERRRGDLGADALGQRPRALLGRLVEDDAELLAAVARADVGFARARDQDLRQLGQHRVALQVAVRVVDLLEVVEVDHQERDALVVAPRPVHLLQEALRQGAPVGQLGQLVGERVLLLRLEQLGVADGDRALRGDTVEQVGLVLGQLAPGVAGRAPSRPSAGPIAASGRPARAADDRPPRGPARRRSASLSTSGRMAASAVRSGSSSSWRTAPLARCGQVVLGLPAHLGLAGRHQVHRPGDRAHDPAGVGQGDVQDLLERQRRVDGRGDRQQEAGPVARAALVGEGGLKLARGRPRRRIKRHVSRTNAMTSRTDVTSRTLARSGTEPPRLSCHRLTPG